MPTKFTFTEGTLILNEEQTRIVQQPAKQNLRILASAGSGKTTTLTARIAYLLTYVNPPAKPHEIILLTFTHNAANVMRQRLETLVGSHPILCGTFHALSQQILSMYRPISLTDTYHVDELPLKMLDFMETERGKQWISTLRYIFIDEYQDINETQYRFIRALHHSRATITIVGDDAQNIYSWRGSCVDYILNFHKKFDDVVDIQLSTNYRSTSSIIAVANSIMRHIPTLPHKECMTAVDSTGRGERPNVYYFSRISEERDWVAKEALCASQTGSVVILSKFNSVLFMFEDAILKMGGKIQYLQDGKDEFLTKQEHTIGLSTFHGSKGMEWDHVFLVRMNDDVFPQQKDEVHILQERRLFYVAVTRARKTLTFSYSRTERCITRFLREIHSPLLLWRNLPRYELSSAESSSMPTSVYDWVHYLTGEDYRVLKTWNVFPPTMFESMSLEEDVLQKENRGQNTWITPFWWVEHGFATEFFDFLCAFWHREIALHRPESGGQWDKAAHRLIWTIKITQEDATFFEKYRTLFEHCIETFFGETVPGTPPPQIEYSDLVLHIRTQFPQTSFDQPTRIRIMQILHKIRTVLYNLRFANVSLHDFQFSAGVRHSPPQEERCRLIESWRSYTSGKQVSSQLLGEEIQPIYFIGLCRSIAAGRSGVMSLLPGEREWTRCRAFLSELQVRIQRLLQQHTCDPVLCRVQTECIPGVFASIDMLLGTTAWIFVGGDVPHELVRLDRMIGILISVHALRIAGYTIDAVCVYQIITGIKKEFLVASWTHSLSNLLTAYVQARAQHQSTNI
jgi:hypothetical protein